MTRAKLAAAIGTAGLVGLALTPQPVQAAARKPGLRVTLPPSAAPTSRPAAEAATPAPKPTPRPAGPAPVVTLPLDLKDPYTAYSMGLFPFASTVAARYVGTTRLSWRIDDELGGAATRQTLMDWGLLVGGGAILGLSAAMPPGSQGQVAFVGATALLAIPLSHWLMYAPFWGEEAVRFNRAEMRRHGFPVDEPTPAAPLILAPADQ